VRKDPHLGILFSTVSFVAGTYVLRESTTHSQWYMDIYLIAGGAIISAIGLITGSWAIQRHLCIRRLEQHARGDQ
jgi:hypothetical protein